MRLGRGWSIGVAVASLTVLGVAGPAFGAAPWSAPQVLAGAYVVRWEPMSLGYRMTGVTGLLGFTPGGAGVAVVGRDAGGEGLTRFSTAQRTFGPVRRSTFSGLAPSRMALFGREGVIVAGQANRASDPRYPGNQMPLDAAVTRGTLSGGFAKRQVLGKGLIAAYGNFGQAIVTALAANSGGDAAAVVSVPVAGKRKGSMAGYRSQLFTRRRGQASFRRVADLGRRTVGQSPAALAVNGPGDVLVAWDDRDRVRARLMRADGRLGDVQELGPGGSSFGGERLVAAMDGTRRMLVAWMAQSRGEMSAGGPGIVALAYAPPYKPFRAAQIVQRDLPRGEDRWISGTAVQAALLRSRGIVAWTGYADGRYVVRTADVTGGRATTPRILSPAGTSAQLRGLAVGPRGATILTWASGAVRRIPLPKPPLTVQAAARAADATTWGPTEDVATTDTSAQDFMASDALVAADPVSAQAVLLWSDPVGPAATPPTPGPVPVRFSVRPPG